MGPLREKPPKEDTIKRVTQHVIFQSFRRGVENEWNLLVYQFFTYLLKTTHVLPNITKTDDFMD